MKLYTEEQVRHAIKMARSSYNLFTTQFMYEQDEIIETLTPIELPSDEKIDRELESHEHTTLELEAGFRAGANYVIYKIQGGNNEQQ